MTYDPTTDAGKVRLLVRDTNTSDHFFTDAEIDAFLTLGDNDVRLAAAEALDTIATDEALVLKVVRILHLQTDGAKLAATLFTRAERLRDSVDETGEFDYAEMLWNTDSERQFTANDFMRNQ